MLPLSSFPEVPRGQLKDGQRSENLEALTFPNESFDLIIHRLTDLDPDRPDRLLEVPVGSDELMPIPVAARH